MGLYETKRQIRGKPRRFRFNTCQHTCAETSVFFTDETASCLISGFRRRVNGIFCDVMQRRLVVRDFWGSLSFLFSRVKQSPCTAWPLKMGKIGCPETSVITSLCCVIYHKNEDLYPACCIHVWCKWPQRNHSALQCISWWTNHDSSRIC
jgi:hypothetical protein